MEIWSSLQLDSMSVVIFWSSLSSNNKNSRYLKYSSSCWIWCFHSSNCEEYCLLGCNSVQSGRSSTFWRNILPPNSRQESKPNNQQAVPVACLTLWPGRWKQYIHLKCWTPTGPHGITSKTTVIYNTSYLYSCMKKDYLKIYMFHNY